jgi:hypothetical protein
LREKIHLKLAKQHSNPKITDIQVWKNSLLFPTREIVD